MALLKANYTILTEKSKKKRGNIKLSVALPKQNHYKLFLLHENVYKNVIVYMVFSLKDMVLFEIE